MTLKNLETDMAGFMGLDLGHSMLKVARGESGGNLSLVLSQSAWVDNRPNRHTSPGRGLLEVSVDGSPYYFSNDRNLLHSPVRQLYADFCFTQEYEAIFHAAILLADAAKTECLVIGLPVKQALTKSIVEDVTSRLVGCVEISPGRSAEIKDVLIVPSPAGAFKHMIATADPLTSYMLSVCPKTC